MRWHITDHTWPHFVEHIGRMRLSGKTPVVEIVPEKRSADQNRLQRLWLSEAALQGDQTAEEYRGECKLRLGVPILRMENDEFREKYDRIVRPLPYEQKLELMMEPIDFPITRLMDKKQKTKYLDAMYRHFAGLGMRLTDPDGLLQSAGQYPEARRA